MISLNRSNFIPLPTKERTEIVFLFFFALTLWNIAYLPEVVFSPLYRVVTFSSYGLWVIFFFSSIGKLAPVISKSPLTRIYIFAIAWQALMLAIGIGFDLRDVTAENYFFPVVSSFLCFYLGTIYRGVFSLKFWIIYSIPVVVIALYTCAFRLDSLEIQTEYLVNGKNFLAVIWGLAAIGLVFFSAQKGNLFSILNIMAFFLIACCLISRARTAFLGICFIVGLILCMRYFKKNIFTIIIGGIVFIAVVGVVMATDNSLSSVISESLFKGRDMENLDSISSGRVSRMSISLNAFLRSPIFGLWGSPTEIPWVHNFLLNILSARGFFGGLGCIVLYFSLCGVVIKGIHDIYKHPFFEDWHLGYYLLLYILIISLAEPTFPLSPTTVCGIAFICLGQSLRIRDFPNWQVKSFDKRKSI